jgi:hypothetical protein
LTKQQKEFQQYERSPEFLSGGMCFDWYIILAIAHLLSLFYYILFEWYWFHIFM